MIVNSNSTIFNNQEWIECVFKLIRSNVGSEVKMKCMELYILFLKDCNIDESKKRRNLFESVVGKEMTLRIVSQ